VLFVINGLVFTLIGLQLPWVVRDLDTATFLRYTGYSLALAVVVVVVRLIWVFPATYIPRWLSPTLRRREPPPPWTVVAMVGWTGMRGIVSLAAVIAIPETLKQRPLLIFLTYAVILVTLLLPALTLPRLKKWLKLEDGGDHQREEALARIAATEAVVARTGEWRERRAYPEELLDPFRARFERRLRTIRPNVAETAASTISEEDLVLRRMTRESIEAERGVLVDLRRRGEIHDEVFHHLAYELDIEDMRLRTQRW
jgi:CPA1 family monovalent cation:H+ antiporter